MCFVTLSPGLNSVPRAHIKKLDSIVVYRTLKQTAHLGKPLHASNFENLATVDHHSFLHFESQSQALDFLEVVYSRISWLEIICIFSAPFKLLFSAKVNFKGNKTSPNISLLKWTFQLNVNLIFIDWSSNIWIYCRLNSVWRIFNYNISPFLCTWESRIRHLFLVTLSFLLTLFPLAFCLADHRKCFGVFPIDPLELILY